MIGLPFARNSPVHNTFETSDIPQVINSRLMGYMRLTTNGKTETERITPRSVVLLAAMIIVVLVIPALLGRSSTSEEFDRSPIDALNIANPEIIFLGNSLLYSRIDPEYISQITGYKSISLAIDGTGPGVWYLQLRNIVGAMTSKPDTVFIFFHDDLITRQISFTGSKDPGLIERLTNPDTPLKRSVRTTDQNFAKWFTEKLAVIYPVAGYAFRQNFINFTVARVVGMDPNEIQLEIDQLSALANKREQAAIIQQPKFHGTFESKLHNSYLLALIQTAMEYDVDLVLIRTAARPNHDGSPNEPYDLAKYSSDLKQYLIAQEVGYIDMTGHPSVDAAMYYDGYHLRHRFRPYYTELFAEWVHTLGGSD